MRNPAMPSGYPTLLCVLFRFPPRCLPSCPIAQRAKTGRASEASFARACVQPFSSLSRWRCELPNRESRHKNAGNLPCEGPFFALRGQGRVRNRKKVAQKSEFLFLRNGSSQRSSSCERHVCLQCQSGRAAARNHRASTMQALMSSPLAKIPR